MGSPSHPVRIVVVGVGGGGGNAIDTMLSDDETGVEFIAANTDAQALQGSKAKLKIQIGEKVTGGWGAGTDPEVGREAAEESAEEIAKVLNGADLVFITLGMGGGTGTGASPVIADIAREKGALTVAVVTRPFSFEGDQRAEIASEGIEKLKSCVDAMVTISNDRVLEVATEQNSMANAYALGDQVLKDSVQGIYEVITKRGYINCDFADLRTVLRRKGTALLGRGTASGPSCVVEAARRAIASPLLDDIDVRSATHLLFNITSASELSVKDFSVGTQVIKEQFDSAKTKIKFGHVIDDSLSESGEVHVTIIATGFPTEDSQQKERQAVRSQETSVRQSQVQPRYVEEEYYYQPEVVTSSTLRSSHAGGRRAVGRATGQHAGLTQEPSYGRDLRGEPRDTVEHEPFFSEPPDREVPYNQVDDRVPRRSHARSVRHSHPPLPATTEELPHSPREQQATRTNRFLRNSEAVIEPKNAPSEPPRSVLEDRSTLDTPPFLLREHSSRTSRRSSKQDDD